MRDLRPGDVIYCQGIVCEIKEITYQEPWEWRGAYYLEFYDTNGNYRSWKQNFDGGCAVLKDYESRNSKRRQLEEVLKMQLTDEQVKALSVGWMAFYDEPEVYRNGIVVDCVKRFLEEE